MNRVLLLALVLCVAGMVGGPAQANPPEEAAKPKADPGVNVLCEVWRVTDPATVKIIEAESEKPGGAATIHDLLTKAGDKAERVSRFLTPTAIGAEVSHQDKQERAIVTAPRKGPTGAVSTGFGGFTSSGAKLHLICRRNGTQIGVQLKVDVSGSGKANTDAPVIVPPNRWTVSVSGSVNAQSGTLRMFQSNTHGSDTVLVFVRATNL